MQPIESYMILPVQRIPRYELLLKVSGSFFVQSKKKKGTIFNQERGS